MQLMETTPIKSESNDSSLVAISFDLESYLSRYEENSNTRLNRLLFIASFNSPEVQQEEESKPNRAKIPIDLINNAVMESEKQIKAMQNVKLYKEFHEHCLKKDNIKLNLDQEWIQTTQVQTVSQLETLKARLSSAQSHLSKESIRASFTALAVYYKQQGELRDAMRCYLSSRDYCTTNTQIARVCLDIMELGVLWKNYGYVHSYYSKAKHTNDIFSSSNSSTNSATIEHIQSKIEVAEGLALLCEERYSAACQKFLMLSPDMVFRTLVAQEDLVLYICILSLATLDRNEFQSHLLENFSFQQRLESSHVFLKDVLRCYARAEYGQCIKLLYQNRIYFDLDIYLHRFVDTLFDKITQRCILTYFVPFSTVTLSHMARTFQKSPHNMEQLVEQILLKKNTQLRIHQKDQLIRHVPPPLQMQRTLVRNKVLQMLAEFQDVTTGMMLRLSCLENDVVVNNNSSFITTDDRSRGQGNIRQVYYGMMDELQIQKGGTHRDEMVLDSDE